MGSLSWTDLAQADETRREIWIRDLRSTEKGLEVTKLNSRINIDGIHLLIRLGQRSSVVVTCPYNYNETSPRNSDKIRQILSISYDTLCDWHIILGPKYLDLYNNRISSNSKFGSNIKHEDLLPRELGQYLGVTEEYTVAPDYDDVTDRMVERIDFLKRMLIGDPDNPRLSNTDLIDDVLNAVIFLRFLEDYEMAIGRNRIDLIKIINDNPTYTLGKLIDIVFNKLGLSTKTNLFRLSELSKLGGDINKLIINWIPTFYRDDKQGRYEYDFGLIAAHSIGQIYDKYISLVSYHTQNGRLSLFPEYETELRWQRGTGSSYTPEYIARFMVGQVLQNFKKKI